MIDFFANSIVDFINKCLNNRVVGVYSPLHISYDSDNAVVFETETKVYYWVVSANIDTNKYRLREVILAQDSNLISDNASEYDTMFNVMNRMIQTIKQN